MFSNGWLFVRLYGDMMWAKGARGSYLVFIAPAPEYAAAALVFFVLAGFVLGGSLTVVGVGTLRHPVASRKLHRIYAWLKLALSVFELTMGVWLLVGLMTRRLPDDLSVLFVAVDCIKWSAMGFVYPICLLIAWRSPRPAGLGRKL
jgi:hypothetical protein